MARQQKSLSDIRSIASELEAHERECAIRYENIEKRLDKGDAKFDAMDAKFTKYILGLYVLIVVASGIDRFFS